MAHTTRLVRSPDLSNAAEYAYAAVVAAGSRLIFTAGACPLDESGTTVGIGDVRAQAAQAVANLQVSLGDAGASLDDVIRTTVYVASSQRQDLVATWEVVRDQGRGEVRIAGLTCADPHRRPRPTSAVPSVTRTCRLSVSSCTGQSDPAVRPPTRRRAGRRAAAPSW
jgi:enamine deaminase RidA (YjgF/YER057c/UK114 family)